jgi:ribose 5-phosphate isomerase B
VVVANVSGMTRIAVGSDHAGFGLKSTLAEELRAIGHDVVDLGAYDRGSVDYPDFGTAVANAVVAGDAEFGVCVCGSGIGISIAANRVHGARAALVHDVTSARLSREHNDANIVCFGERLIGVEVAKEALRVFLATAFEGGRHQARVTKLG